MCRIKCIGTVLLILALAACSEKAENLTFWGETSYYSDFLFYKYEPVRMEKTIRLEFNEEAQGIKEVRLGVFEKDDQERYLPASKNIRLYKNGTLCQENVFTISGGENEATIGIEFTPDARFGVHKWYVKVMDSGGLDRVNEFEIGEDPLPVLLEWRAKKIDAWNPLKLTLLWILIALIAFLVLWMLILRSALFPRFKVGAFAVTDPYYSMRRLRGAYKLVCTNKPAKQSALGSFFKGKVIYEVNPFWTKEWVIMPRDAAGIKPNANSAYTFEPYTVTLRKGTEYKVINNTTGEKITIMIN